MIKGFIFDWAGVLGSESYWFWLENHFGADWPNQRQLYQHLSLAVDRGDISEEEFSTAAAKQAGVSADCFRTGVIDGIIFNCRLFDFIGALKQDYKTALLSNFAGDWLRQVLRDNNFYRYFDEVIISSDVRLMKPEPAIFAMMLEKLQLSAAETVFLDDRQINVDTARKLGFNAFLYTSVDQFKRDVATLIG